MNERTKRRCGTLDEREILNRAAMGDKSAMDEISARFGGLIRYIVSGVLHDVGEEEECVNDVLFRVWRSAGTFDPSRASAATWITVIARNTALTFLRTKQRREGLVSDEELPENAPSHETPETELLKRERLERIKKAVGALGDRDSELFYRKYYYMQSVAQIAAEMGMSERSAEGRLYRLRKRLQRDLGGDVL